MTLKDLPAEERPRERLSRYGTEGLSTVELLAILLGAGTQSRTVLELAADLLKSFGSLRALSEASLVELKQVKGIGEAKAIQIQAAFGLIRRLEAGPEGIILDSPEKVYQLIRPELAPQKTERLMVILRNIKRVCIHREIISQGTLSEVLIHPREVFHAAIRNRAHSLIIAHNHPSGDATPSRKDLEMTQLLAAAGTVVGIELADHLVVGYNTFTSICGHLRNVY